LLPLITNPVPITPVRLLNTGALAAVAAPGVKVATAAPEAPVIRRPCCPVPAVTVSARAEEGPVTVVAPDKAMPPEPA
jgi:hypothetical protein